jgi:hypothetical protein
MTAATPPPIPGARALLAWLRDLSGLRPLRLWYAPLLFHHVEALVAAARPASLDPLPLGLLRALAADAPPLPALGLDPQLLTRLCGELESAGLAIRNGDGWRPTDVGRRAAAAGAYEALAPQRRAFHFIDNASCGRPPHFIHLNRPPGGPPPAVADWRFDAAALRDCVGRPPEWKARHQFPADVRRVYGPEAEKPGEPPAWRRVPIDQPEQALLALVEAPAEADGTALHGFTVRPETWTVFREAPLFTLAEWSETLPDAAGDPPEEEWKRAWSEWSQSHGLSAEEAAVCTVERVEGKAHVRAPRRVYERLKAAKGDPLKHEACLLVGGRCRLAAPLEVEAEGG